MDLELPALLVQLGVEPHAQVGAPDLTRVRRQTQAEAARVARGAPPALPRDLLLQVH